MSVGHIKYSIFEKKKKCQQLYLCENLMHFNETRASILLSVVISGDIL